jgi:hypothetical protein
MPTVNEFDYTFDRLAEILDTGHFALEEDGDAIANYINQFLASRLQSVPA